MRRTRRYLSVAAGAAAVALLAGACGSTNHTTTGKGNTGTAHSGGGSNLGSFTGLNASGTPKYGGTLTMLGNGDVQRLDPNISYYTVDYLAERMFSRQLYSYPATLSKNTTVVPDMATAMPVITDGGKTYSMTIRSGVMWDTTPPRQVTGADFMRGVQRTCNPTQAFGGIPDFETLIVGYQAFCSGFGKVSSTSAAAQKAYIDAHPISGITTSGEHITIHLTQPATYFVDILTFPAFSPAPVEYLDYLPSSAQLQQHTISDGPYKVASYSPTKYIDFVRNPAWKRSTDPIRKAYVNKIKIVETVSQQSVQQQLATNSLDAMEWNQPVPTADIPNLISTKNQDFSLQPTFGMNPYFVFNTAAGPLKNLKVRQALEYGINRSHIIQNYGGPAVNPPLTHILPKGIGGSENFNPYPYNPSKAKALLKSAGVGHIKLTFMYASDFPQQQADFQTLQADLGKLGITVKGYGTPQANLFTLMANPANPRKDLWDFADVGWFPDWYGNAAKSFFGPLFDGQILPPQSNDDGLFNSPAVNADIARAEKATTVAAADAAWHQADIDTMKGAAIFPVNQPYFPNFHSSLVHNCVYEPDFANYDPTNVWLSNA
jgi:peptide/nickel transport system substrate-binding protein